MTVPSTTEEKICKKNDVKARSLLLMALQMNINLLLTCDATVMPFDHIPTTRVPTLHEELEQLHDDLEEMDLKWNMALLSMRARKFYQRTGRKIIIDGSSTAGYDKSKRMKFKQNMRSWQSIIPDVSMINLVLQIMKLSKQYDDLLVKLDDTSFKEATYKRGLSILEAQVVKYKESEVLFSEEIALLKRSVGHKEYLMGLLKTELEKVKEEKEGFEFKLPKFEKSSKDLDDLLASQTNTIDLSLFRGGLEEFNTLRVNEYGTRDSSLKPTNVCDRESDNSKENTDDSLIQQPKTVTETSSVMSPLKVDKDWKEKFFHPANHIRVEEPKKARENSRATNY
ncbi:hypothetical protein Tco_1056978 [Tanacetum coccineum]|uniref:Uncharacterized protein n=1 Tax=Tanacetum coccineum TaxID=301880 RepID=A0ABQ5H482_9ASTR